MNSGSCRGRLSILSSFVVFRMAILLATCAAQWRVSDSWSDEPRYGSVFCGRRSQGPGTLPSSAVVRRQMSRERQQLTMLANFVEIFLAREGHDGIVGINLLTKVQMPTLPSLYGAMLAGVDYVLMGAGIPREIPGVLDALAQHSTVLLRSDSTSRECLPEKRWS